LKAGVRELVHGEVTNLMASQPWNALNTVDYRNDEVENGLQQARLQGRLRVQAGF
jgi:hypothetical protein